MNRILKNCGVNFERREYLRTVIAQKGTLRDLIHIMEELERLLSMDGIRYSSRLVRP